MPSVEGLKLKDPKDFRYLGKGQIGIVDLKDITIGKAHYGADTRLPGMKYAVIARPPVTGGKLKSFDATEAMKVSGVEKVMEVKGWPWPSKFQPLGGVAVIARNTGAAIKGRDALKIVWEDGANGKYDSVAYRASLEEAARKPGLVVRKEGDAEAALKGADKVIDRRILPAASGACRHGAAGRGRRRQGRQGARSGRRCKAPAARAKTSPRRSAFPRAMSPSTSRCSAAGSDANRNAISRSRRRCCRRNSGARQGAVDAGGRRS